MEEIEIKRMCDLDDNAKRQVAEVFVEGFYEELSGISKSIDKLIKVFENAFIEESCYLATINNVVVGMVCCSDSKTRAVNIEKQKFLKEFGFIKGNIVYRILNSEFNKPIEFNENIAFVECMATRVESRGKGVATSLLQYIINNLPYTEYILDVTDVNEKAISLYKKAEFKEFERKKERHGKQKGFNERIYMKFNK